MLPRHSGIGNHHLIQLAGKIIPVTQVPERIFVDARAERGRFLMEVDVVSDDIVAGIHQRPIDIQFQLGLPVDRVSVPDESHMVPIPIIGERSANEAFDVGKRVRNLQQPVVDPNAQPVELSALIE